MADWLTRRCGLSQCRSQQRRCLLRLEFALEKNGCLAALFNARYFFKIYRYIFLLKAGLVMLGFPLDNVAFPDGYQHQVDQQHGGKQKNNGGQSQSSFHRKSTIAQQRLRRQRKTQLSAGDNFCHQVTKIVTSGYAKNSLNQAAHEKARSFQAANYLQQEDKNKKDINRKYWHGLCYTKRQREQAGRRVRLSATNTPERRNIMKINKLRMLANQKGFTLIELMIVIAIIGILAAVAIPNFIAYRDKSYCSAAEKDANGLMATVSDYFAIPSHTSWKTVTLAAKTGATFKNGVRWPALSGQNSATIGGTVANIVASVTDGSKRCPSDYMTAQKAAGWSIRADKVGVFTKSME